MHQKMWRMRDLVRMAVEVVDRNWRFDSRVLNVVNKNCINCISVRIFPIWPIGTILSSACFSTSIATQASPELSGKILNEIISKVVESPSSGYEIYYTYTHKLCSCGNLQGAAMLMQSLHDKNIFLGQSAYNCLIKAAGEQNDIDLLCQIFKHLLVCRKPLDSTSYNTLAKVFTMKSDDACLLRFVREVSELIFPGNATVMNRIIYAFGERREVNKAMLIFGQMKSVKCKPDLVTYNAILGVLSETGRIGEMLQVFASMKEEDNLVPDIISFNTVINGFRKVGRLELCTTYFKEMVEKGIEPDLRTYTALIDSFSRSGNIEESLRVFNEMKHKGICPSIQVYELLISNLKKMGKFELAEAFSQEMKASVSSLIDTKDFKKKKR